MDEIDSSGECIGERTYLFVDLFLHEVTVFAFFCSDRVPGDRMHLRLDFRTVQRFDAHGFGRHHCHLPRLQKDHAARVLHDRGRIAGNKIFTIPKTQHHTACVADARRHDFIWFLDRHQHDHVRALDLVERSARGLHQPHPCGEIMFHKMDDGLGIGLRLEFDALRDELILDLEEVLHDTVLDYDHAPGLPHMRMRVARVRRAMRCPARMPDSRRAVDGRFIDEVDQLG